MNEDYERIDWLAMVAQDIPLEIRVEPHLKPHNTVFQIRLQGGNGTNQGFRTQLAEGSNLREAIDAAMKVIR